MNGPIRNPILPGFHPDPSILRVGEDFYIATSTFEWFPGVEIHHSRDLVHWHLLTRPLTRFSQLDMRGVACGAGVWAPCLSWHQGTFYLVYTCVWRVAGGCVDLQNYLVTSPSAEGPWSEPVKLNAEGFDPSLFHDQDGSHWLVNLIWNQRPGRDPFAGIALRRYDPEARRLTGSSVRIFGGTALGVTEGPHLYRRGGYYYLLTAEGGTSWNHAVTVARSRRIEGPYRPDPAGPLLTSADDPAQPLQKAGHGSLVRTAAGEWYLAHLCARPLETRGACILGRETALQKVTWTADGWPRLEGGGHAPRTAVPAPALPAHPWPDAPVREDFSTSTLPAPFQTLRCPLGADQLSLTARPGWLRLYGQESLHSTFHQSLVARRLESFACTADTYLEFYPQNPRQMAGLVCYYSTENYYYLCVTKQERGTCLELLQCDNGTPGRVLRHPRPLPGGGAVCLRARISGGTVRFFWKRPDETRWHRIGPALDMHILSDEYMQRFGKDGFTGTFVGLCCQDLTGEGLYADFDWMDWREDSAARKKETMQNAND